MKQKCPLLLTVTCCLTIVMSYAQDKIYFQSEIKDGKVVEFTPDKIKFKNPLNPGPVYTVSRSKVLLVFNNTGGFLVVSKLSPDTDPLLQNFLHTVPAATDRLITLQSTVIDATIQREDETTVYYSAGNKTSQMAKSLLAAIIFRNGQHKLFTDAANILEPLSAAQQIIARLNTPVSPAPENKKTEVLQTVAANNTATTSAVAVNTSAGNPASFNKAAEPIAQKEPAAETIPAATAVKKPAARPGKNIEELGDVSFAEYEKKALDKTYDLSNYLKKLCDKSVDWEEANKAIDQAVDLFVSEDALVETSSKNNSSITKYKIRQYLKRVKLIQYDKVEIEWTNIQYVSKLRKGPDGNYYGTITFEQIFRGYSGDNQLSYSDVTRKSVEVMLKTNTKNIEGKTVSTWDVFLSEVKVVSTKA